METERQKALRDFVTKMHGAQKRKYTGEPYVNHCFEVGKYAEANGIQYGLEIGFSHDLIEDTECTLPQLLDFLLNTGYDNIEAMTITFAVSDLTDVFTHEDYPKLNRKKRKNLECGRLGTIDPISQSVKYCDIINNTKSICKHDPKFAKTYLKEIDNILTHMKKGNAEIFQYCRDQVRTELILSENDSSSK